MTMTRDDDNEGRVLDALRADAREKDAWRLGHDRRVRESTRSDAIGRDSTRMRAHSFGLTTVVIVAQLIDALRASGAKTLERCANAANAIDRAVLDGERASCDVASVSCEFRILSHSQFLEKRVDEDDEAEEGERETTEEKDATMEGETTEAYAEVARKAMDAIRGRWAQTRDGGLGLTGNTYWRPLPAVIGTMAYYGDESCGLDPFVAKNPNPVRWGEYISSDDDDSSDVSDDSSDTLESDISSEFISSTSSEGDYSDVDEHLADIDDFERAARGGNAAMEDAEEGGDLFSSAGLSSMLKSAKKAAPSYALSYDDVFGGDIRRASSEDLFSAEVPRSDGSLFESAESTETKKATPATKAPEPRKEPKKPKGLFDSDSEDEGDLFGIGRRTAGGDLFSAPVKDSLEQLKEAIPTPKPVASTSNDIHPPTAEVASMTMKLPKSPLFADSDSDEDDKLFSTKAINSKVPSNITKDGLFE